MTPQSAYPAVSDWTSLPAGNTYHFIARRPVIHYLVLGEGNFCTDREILLPDPSLNDPQQDALLRATALGIARAALEFARLQPHRLLIAGHTDTVGSAAFNLGLSERRAENVRLFVAGERAGWASHCHNNAEVADWQTVLRWVALARGWDCDPGPVDSDDGPMTAAARTNFRAAYNELFGGSLGVDAPHGPDDWSAYFDLYEAVLAEQLGCEREDLSDHRSRICWNTPATLACGEYWPIDAVGREHFPSATNRRVELLFLPANSAIPLAEHPPGKAIYERCRFEVRPIAAPQERPGRKLWIRFPFSVDQVCRYPWKLTLTSGGNYHAERAMCEAIHANEYADLCFDGLDSNATYTLRLGNDDEEMIVFEAIPFLEIGGLSPEGVGQSGADEEAVHPLLAGAPPAEELESDDDGPPLGLVDVE